ncbi:MULTISPECIES: tyrosinase family protein [unclassified Streptomyces]|uniref:tyrosinase family protein n=1 Tax=unclassified Streptomyces TaxID=2593676 RepID=UPI0029A6FCC9|nr:tyrosinase family protein [Streptomyces sp. DK15]MDX2390418.1 tyrosinase family protein [Streptomyces sp. DK15]
MYTRKNQKDLTADERAAFVNAVLEIKRRGVYDEFVRLHGQYFVSDGEGGQRVGHMSPSFFPWHRQYLLEFERALQQVDPKVTLPYWDWTVDRSTTSGLWADDFLGGNGRAGDRRVMTGPFAHDAGRWSVNVGVTEEKYLMRDFGRPADPVALPTPAELALAVDDPVYDASPWDSTSTTAGFRNKVEGWTVGEAEGWHNHNRVHLWVGGQMTGGTSPNDPVFWLHHTFIDLIWARWQRRHPGAGYEPSRPVPAGDPQHGRVISLDEPMSPWQVRPSALLDHTRFYQYAE